MRSTFLCLPALILIPTLHASVLVTKQRDVLAGKIKGENGNIINFETKYGEIKVDKKDILRLIYDESQIKPTEVKDDKGNLIQARLVDENDAEQVFLQADGSILRKKKPQVKKQAVETPRIPRHMVTLAGGFGYSEFPDLGFQAGPVGFPQRQAFSLGRLNINYFSAGYDFLWKFFSLGADVSLSYGTGSSTITRSDNQLKVNITSSQLALAGFITGKFFINKLLVKEDFLDLGFGGGAGYGLVRNDMQFVHSNPSVANTGGTVEFSGTNKAPVFKGIIFAHFWLNSTIAIGAEGGLMYLRQTAQFDPYTAKPPIQNIDAEYQNIATTTPTSDYWYFGEIAVRLRF